MEEILQNKAIKKLNHNEWRLVAREWMVMEKVSHCGKGDLLFIKDDILMVVECKNVENNRKRLLKVKEQSMFYSSVIMYAKCVPCPKFNFLVKAISKQCVNVIVSIYTDKFDHQIIDSSFTFSKAIDYFRTSTRRTAALTTLNIMFDSEIYERFLFFGDKNLLLKDTKLDNDICNCLFKSIFYIAKTGSSHSKTVILYYQNYKHQITQVSSICNRYKDLLGLSNHRISTSTFSQPDNIPDLMNSNILLVYPSISILNFFRVFSCFYCIRDEHEHSIKYFSAITIHQFGNQLLTKYKFAKNEYYFYSCLHVGLFFGIGFILGFGLSYVGYSRFVLGGANLQLNWVKPKT